MVRPSPFVPAFVTALTLLVSSIGAEATTAPRASAAQVNWITTHRGVVVRLGPWRVDGDRTLGGAIGAFGRPSNIDGGQKTPRASASTAPTVTLVPPRCTARWSSLQLVAGYAYGRRGDCGDRRGSIYWLSIGSSTWRTIPGLRVGDSSARLRRLYPDAKWDRYLKRWNLVWARSARIGKFETVSATMRKGRVAALNIWILDWDG